MSKRIAEKDMFHLYKILGHPVRRRLVEVIGEQGTIGFSEIRNRLQMGPGTLYYHFDILSGLITQDDQRRYTLTDLGKYAYQVLHSKEYEVTSLAIQEGVKLPGEFAVGRVLRSIFFPRGFFMQLFSSPKLGWIVAFITIGFGIVISILARLKPILFSFEPSYEITLMIPVTFFFSWIATFIFAELFSLILFRRKGEDSKLLIGCAVSFLPLLPYPCLVFLNTIFGWDLAIVVNAVAARLLLLMLQVWSFGFLAAATCVSKGLRLDRAALVSLIVAYASIAYFFISTTS